MYEVMTHGEIPYKEQSNQAMLDFLNAGNRLEQPVQMDDQLYRLALNCWEQKPLHRPNFNRIYTTLDNFLNNPLGQKKRNN